MDFPVEATVHLSAFPDKAEVRRILRSHSFTMTDLSGNRLRVRGSFLKLKDAKALLERLLSSQAQTGTGPRPSSPPVPAASPGAVPRYRSSRGWLGSRDKPPHASPSSPETSASWMSSASQDRPVSSFSPRADQRAAFRCRGESFVIDTDVFRYAEKLRKKDVDIILYSHNVKIELCNLGDSSSIILLGKGARTAASKLQSLLSDLSKLLRTQEVPRKEIGHDGEALLRRIRKNNNIHNSVLVCETDGGLHLVGPSSESYELKQRLLGKQADRSQPSGRMSSSLLPIDRKHAQRDGGAGAALSPVGSAGYSPFQVPGQRTGRRQALVGSRGFFAEKMHF